VWKKADIRGHHETVLYSNEALCLRKMGDVEKSKEACKEGLTQYTAKRIKDKLQFNLDECEKVVAEPTEEHMA